MDVLYVIQTPNLEIATPRSSVTPWLHSKGSSDLEYLNLLWFGDKLINFSTIQHHEHFLAVMQVKSRFFHRRVTAMMSSWRMRKTFAF